MRYLSKGEITTNICNFYEGLIVGDMERMLSTCTNNVTLEWTSSKFRETFRGKNDLMQWAENLRQMFPKIMLEKVELRINSSKAKHQFIFNLSAPDGRMGMLPAVVVYDLKNGKLQHILVTLSKGFLIFSKAQVNSLGIK